MQWWKKSIELHFSINTRTVRYALKRSKAEGLIEEKLYVKDARQCLYGLKNSVDKEESSNFPCGFI